MSGAARSTGRPAALYPFAGHICATGIGAGDEVILPSWTFVATAASVLMVNARPVLVDVELGTGCLDPDAVEAAITPRTRAVIAVHIAGHPADMDPLLDLAGEDEEEEEEGGDEAGEEDDEDGDEDEEDD